MRQVVESALAGLVAAALLAAIQGIGAYAARDLGSIRVGTSLNLGGKNFMEVEVQNFEDDPIDELILAARGQFDRTNIVTNSPVKIDITAGADSNSSILVLRSIAPNQSTRIFISHNGPADDLVIRPVNAKEKRLTVSVRDEVRRSVRDRALAIGAISLFFGITLSVVYYLTERLIERYRTQMKAEIEKLEEKLEKETEKANKDYELVHVKYEREHAESKRAVEQARGTQVRIQTLLCSRLLQYGRELDYWRQTVRELLLRSPNVKLEADEIFRTVSKTLGTLETQRRDPLNFESRDIAEIVTKFLEGAETTAPPARES